MNVIVKNKFTDHFQACGIGCNHRNILCDSNKTFKIIQLLFNIVNEYENNFNVITICKSN